MCLLGELTIFLLLIEEFQLQYLTEATQCIIYTLNILNSVLNIRKTFNNSLHI